MNEIQLKLKKAASLKKKKSDSMAAITIIH